MDDPIQISIVFNQEKGLRVTVFVLPQMKIDSIDPCVRTYDALFLKAARGEGDCGGLA